MTASIENEARLGRMILPVREMLAGHPPGTYVLSVLVSETKNARVPYEQVHQQIVRLTLETAIQMRDGEVIVLQSDRLPFAVHRCRANTGTGLQGRSAHRGRGTDA